MARFHVNGLDGLEDFLGNAGQIPYDVIETMLDAQADVVVAAQREAAAQMLSGPHSKGVVERSIRKGRLKRTKNGLVRYVNFSGSQHGTRLAELASINEYGKKGQAARPFVRTANEQCAERAQQTAEQVFDQWIEHL